MALVVNESHLHAHPRIGRGTDGDRLGAGVTFPVAGPTVTMTRPDVVVMEDVWGETLQGLAAEFVVHREPDARPQRIAHLVITLDPRKLDVEGGAGAPRRLADLVSRLEAAGSRLPGAGRKLPDEIDDDEVLNLDPSLEKDLHSWASRLDVVALPQTTQQPVSHRPDNQVRSVITPSRDISFPEPHTNGQRSQSDLLSRSQGRNDLLDRDNA